MATVFLDTSFAIAAASKADVLHTLANEWLDYLDAVRARFVTTQAVALEIGNAFAKSRVRNLGIAILKKFHLDPRFETIEVNTPLFGMGFELFCARPDKDRSLVDCISFVVMSERGLTDALTADVHFEQAGFRALLRGTSPPRPGA